MKDQEILKTSARSIVKIINNYKNYLSCKKLYIYYFKIAYMHPSTLVQIYSFMRLPHLLYQLTSLNATRWHGDQWYKKERFTLFFFFLFLLQNVVTTQDSSILESPQANQLLNFTKPHGAQAHMTAYSMNAFFPDSDLCW